MQSDCANEGFYVSQRPIIPINTYPTSFERTMYDGYMAKSLRMAPRQKLGAFHIDRQRYTDTDGIVPVRGLSIQKSPHFPPVPGVIPPEYVAPNVWTPYM